MATKIINDITISDPPSIAGGDCPNMLILGGGKGLWEDYFAAREVMPSSHIMCVNDIAAQFKAEKIQHAVSLHHRLLPAVCIMRKEKGMLEKVCRHSSSRGAREDSADVYWCMQNGGGTSGLFATKIAIAMGSKHIILCGLPIDSSGHYFDPPTPEDNRTTKFAENHSSFAEWRDMKKSKLVMSRVRSMSGNTGNLFGKPTKEWVQS
jgi:hypothetical protein